MPFTPFHFSAHTCIGLPVRGKINIAVFILSNVIIDIEPLMVMLFNLSYPLHGYAHTFIGAGIVGSIWGIISYQFKDPLAKILKILKLPKAFTLKQYIVSGILGTWLHVLFDAPLYTDIKPFFPISANPMYGIVSEGLMYNLCGFLYIPALLTYSWYAIKHNKRHNS